MTLDEFNALPAKLRTDIYLRFQPFIAAWETPKHLFLLYIYKELYVEVMFRDELMLERIRAITAGDAIKRYDLNLPAMQRATASGS